MADTTATTERDRPATSRIAPVLAGVTDDVGGLLEGIGQAVRETMAHRKLYEIVILWLMGMYTAKKAVEGIRDAIHSDPNLEQLRHALWMEKYGLITENAEHYLGLCIDFLRRNKDTILEKGGKAWTYITEHDAELAELVRQNTTTVRSRIPDIRSRREEISIIPGKQSALRLWHWAVPRYQQWRVRRQERRAAAVNQQVTAAGGAIAIQSTGSTARDLTKLAVAAIAVVIIVSLIVFGASKLLGL